MKLRRRTFLGAGVAAAAAGSLISCAREAGGEWRFFTVAEARTVDAICEQLIPADRDPGAKQAGVVNYIDIQLTKAFRRHRAIYRKGLAGVDTASRAKFGQEFADLSPERQREVLTAVEQDSKAFFELILTHTRQGFYGAPRHGDNRRSASGGPYGPAGTSPPVAPR